MARLRIFLAGIGLGVLGYALYQRQRRLAEREDPERLLANLSEQVDDLESLMKRSRSPRQSVR